MAISLFQLSAAAWLNPQIVGQAIQGTVNAQLPELLDWAEKLPDFMGEAEFDLRRVSRVGQVVQNLSAAVESGNHQKAHRAKEKLARLTLGIRGDEDKAKWQTVAWRSYWQGGENVQAFVSASPVFPVEHYRANPVITANYDELSFVQKLAIFAVVQELYKQKVGDRFVGRAVDWVNLEWTWRCEFAVARAKGIPIDLRVFVEHCIINWDKFFLREERYPPSRPYSILDHLMGIKQGLFARMDGPTERLPFVTDALIARVGKVIFERSEEQRASFVENMLEFSKEKEMWKFSTAEKVVTAAIELLEAGFSLDEDLFLKYASAPNRQRRLEEAMKVRAGQLAQGAEVGDTADPFEMMAVLTVLGRVDLPTALRVVREAKIPDRSAGVYYRSFSFPVQLVKPFYNVANKGILEKYAREIAEISTFPGLIKAIKNFEGSKAARRRIDHLLQRADDISVKLSSMGIRQQRTEVLEILQGILHILKQWIAERAGELVKTGKEKDLNVATVKVSHEIDKYLVKLLIGNTFWMNTAYLPVFFEIFAFNKKTATEEDTYKALDLLSEFYIGYLPDVEKKTLGELFPSLPSLYAIQRQLEKMNEKRQNLTGEFANVTLLPGIGKLDAFYGYMSENCLAREDYARYGMSDPDFVPYRIVVDGKWRGVVQTFTKNVGVGGEKKKILIVTGVDPQLNLTPSPEEFLNGLEKGFWGIAREGDYDLVVVPAAEFAQSSRRALLGTAFKRYREEIEIKEPVGFPKIGVHPDGSPIYYYNKVHGEGKHQKFLVFRNPNP